MGRQGMSAIASIRRWFLAGGPDPSVRRARRLLGALLVVIAVLLAIGDPDEGVPERQAEGKHVRAKDYLRTWGWYAGAANGVATALLLLGAPLWAVGGEAAGSPLVQRPAQAAGSALKLAVAGAVVAGACLSAPRLDHSFWRDEETSAARYVDGEWHDHDGQLQFDALPWRHTLWMYDTPNNHVGYSAMARVSIGLHDALFARGPFVSERAMRVPAFLAGLGAVVSAAWLLWRLGRPGAAAIAAWLLALHPWWSRYASEARGYSTVMLGATAAPALLARALERGSWGRWLAVGAVQCLLLWTNASILYLLLPLNLGALVFLWRAHRGTPALRQQLGRMLVANAVGAAVFLQLMLPNLVQLRHYLAVTRATRDLEGWLVSNSASLLLAGVPWTFEYMRDPAVYPELMARAAELAVPFALVLAAVVLCALSGVAQWARGDAWRATVALSFLLCAPLAWISSWSRSDPLYPWYFAFALPGLVVLVALGLDRARRALAARASEATGWGAVLAFAAAFTWLVAPFHTALITRPIKPERESVRLTRPVADPTAPENRRIATVQCPDKSQYYDPRVITVDSVTLLERVAAAAARDGQTLFVNCGRLHHVRKHRPELMARLAEAPDFEEVAYLPGMTPVSTRVVYRWLGPSAAADGAGGTGPRAAQ